MGVNRGPIQVLRKDSAPDEYWLQCPGAGVWDGGGGKVVELAKTMFLWSEDIVCLFVF